MSTQLAYGREEVVYAAAESAYGDLAAPAGTDAMKALATTMTLTQERADRLEKGSTRSITSRITRRKSAEWSIEKHIIPSGTAGTAPDDALLWKALFGTQTINAGTSVVYSLTAEPDTSLSIYRNYGPHREAVSGAVPSKLAITYGGGDEPKAAFSGVAKDHYLCGSGTLSSAASATSTITVTDASQFSVGMLVQVGSENNSGTGFEITAIDFDTNQLTLDASVTSQSEGAEVVPLALTPVTTGTVIPVVVGSVTIGASTVYITEGGFEIDQKATLRNDEFGYDSARGFRYPERRAVTMNMTLYFERGAAKWVNDAKRFGAQDITVVLGESAGSMVQIDAGNVEFAIPSVTIPESEECTLPITGVCLGSSGEDEISVTFK